MTEAEAREKWCPMARWKFSTMSDSPASNREGSHDGPSTNSSLIAGTRCIASDCMMWRTDHANTLHGPQGVTTHSGFCGLAGRPE